MTSSFFTLRISSLLLLFLISSISCSKKEKEVIGIDLSHMDKSVKPTEDFYRYVNGAWLDQATIPDDRSRWGNFDQLRKNTDADVISLVEYASRNNTYDKGTDQRKAIDYFKTIMDTTARNKAGATRLLPYFEKVDAVSSMSELTMLLSELVQANLSAYFGMGVFSDPKNTDMNALYFVPASLGLPEREYYLGDDSDSKEKREKYLAYVSKMHMRVMDIEQSEADQIAKVVLNLETQLARTMMTKEDRRDARNRYNPMTVSGDLMKKIPSIDWKSYFDALGISEDNLIATEKAYTLGLQKFFSSNSLADLKTLLKWSVYNDMAGTLSLDSEKMKWEFYGKEMRGSKAQRPIKERAISSLNRNLGEAIGKVYVDKKFPPEAKAKAKAMVNNILKAFEKRINALEWMSDETKVAAMRKLASFNVKIGYPDKWEDYSELEIVGPDDGGMYFDNVVNISKWEFKKDIKKIGQPVDKSKWFMSPQTVNAYYNPYYNEIVFPAAILQPPFYDYRADEAVNYGGIGAVIGHEISHGFDDSGSRFDENGNLNNWWEEKDLTKFKTLGNALVAQYDALEPLDSVFVNGTFTLGENIGDLGGVNVAYDGLQMFFEQSGAKPNKIDGFTPEQRFFLSWATIWRNKTRDEALRTQIKTDPHAPGMYRGYVPLLNVDAFHEAFGTKEGDGMYIPQEERVKIW